MWLAEARAAALRRAPAASRRPDRLRAVRHREPCRSDAAAAAGARRPDAFTPTEIMRAHRCAWRRARRSTAKPAPCMRRRSGSRRRPHRAARGRRPAQRARQARRRARAAAASPRRAGMVLLTSRVSRSRWCRRPPCSARPLIVAVSAPTALAVRTAEAAGITLVAVARGDGFEIFTHPSRVITHPSRVITRADAQVATEAASQIVAARVGKHVAASVA